MTIDIHALLEKNPITKNYYNLNLVIDILVHIMI